MPVYSTKERKTKKKDIYIHIYIHTYIYIYIYIYIYRKGNEKELPDESFGL